MSTKTVETAAARKAGQIASYVTTRGALGDVVNAVTRVSGSTGEELPILASAHVEISEGQMVVESTDRYRIIEATVPGVGDGEAAGVVPHVVLAQLKKMLGKVRVGDEGEPATITLGEEEFTVEVAGQCVTARLVEGQYPKIRSLWSQTRGAVEKVGVNPGYLQDLCMMPRAKSTPLVMEFNTSGKPMVSEWSTGRSEAARVKFRHLLMLVRVAE